MPTMHALIAFAIASLVIVVIPGPSVLFVVGRTLALGRRGGLLSVLGNELGALLLVAAVAFGVGTVVAESLVVFTTIKLLGAVYLVYLGIQMIRHRHDATMSTASIERQSVSPLTTFRQGFFVGVTNPKTVVFFVAVLPQFVDFAAGMVAAQMMVLGLVFTLVALVFDSVWALIAGTARQWLSSSPRRLAALRSTGGALIVGLGTAVALTGQKA